LRVERRRQQVAVWAQAFRDRIEAGVAAVGDQRELLVRRELSGQGLRLRRQCLGIGAGQANQQQARAWAFAEFVDQQFLCGGFG
jgi:hypothetical protein